MSRLNFRKDGEEHNFWQNYTDIMSGLLIIFIIASLIGYKQTWQDSQNYNAYKEIAEIFQSKNNFLIEGFEYDSISQSFRYSRSLAFESNNAEIKSCYQEDLEKTGKRLKTVIDSISRKNTNVAFKIILDGRAAKHLDKGSKAKNDAANRSEKDDMAILSFRRAYNISELWKKHGFDINDIKNAELIVSGSGFGGKYRHPANEEDLNKTVLIQVIPYIRVK